MHRKQKLLQDETLSFIFISIFSGIFLMTQEETNTTPEQLAGPSNATNDIKCKQEPDMDTSVNIKTEVIKQEDNAARASVKSESLSIALKDIKL